MKYSEMGKEYLKWFLPVLIVGSVFPASMLHNLRLKKGEKIIIREEDGKLVLQPIRKPEYSLMGLLAQCDGSITELDQDDQAWLHATPIGREVL